MRHHYRNLFLILGAAAIGLGFVHLRLLRSATDPESAQLIPDKATTGGAKLAAPKLPRPETRLYLARRGDTVISVARRFLGQTSYLTSRELAEAIRGVNSGLDRTFLKSGEQLTIPGILDRPTEEKSISLPKDFEVRAIYLTGLMAASDHGIQIVKRWRQVGGNAVVFDIKDSDGTINIPFEHPLVAAHKAYLRDLPKYIHFLHSQGMHAIARIATFRDERLVLTHPELAVKSRKTGQSWREKGKLVWTDPSRIEVQEYDIALALAAVDAGVDEIQFDYVRFPAEGDQKDASFSFEKRHPQWQRADVIVDFLERAYFTLHPKGVLVSLDVFGVMAWQRRVDLSRTGQDIVRMAQFSDVLSPMI